MKTLSFATTAYALAAIVALTVAAQADAPKPEMIADGVSSPVTHLLEVVNAPVLQTSKTDTVHGTLAERPSPVRKTDTAFNK